MDETVTVARPQAQVDETPTSRRLPEVPWPRLFVVVAVLFGIFFAVAMPPMQEHDAFGHLVRVDRMSRGTFVEPLDDEGQTNASYDGCLAAFMRHHMNRGSSDRSLDLRGNWIGIPCKAGSESAIPTSALTSPVPYVPNALGYTAAKVVGAGVNGRVLAARLASLAAYVVTVWAALRLAPKGRGVLFAVAVLPTSLALAASVHADATGIAAALMSVALTLRAREHPTRAGLAGLAASLVVLALSKNLYGPFVLLVLLVPATAFADRRARWCYVGATLGVTGVLTAAWSSYVARSHYVVPFLGIDSEKAQAHVIHHPVDFLHSAWNGLWDPFFRRITLPGFVEVLGGLRASRLGHAYGDVAPLPIVLVAAVVLALAVFADPGTADRARARLSRQVAAVTGLVAVAGVTLIYLGMALTANPPGADTLFGAQGRYFVPLAALVAFASGRRLSHQPTIALAVPAGSLVLLAWVGWRVFVVFY